MNNPTLIDSSFLFALFHFRDKNHHAAIEFSRTAIDIMLVPDIIMPEVAYLFIRDIGYSAIEPFLGSLASTNVQFQSITMSDIQRAQQIMRDYPRAKFDLVDACIMALSERLEITQVCTFDRRDFSIFRPKHCDYLELLPQ